MPAPDVLIESTLADLTTTSLADLRTRGDELLRATLARLLGRIEEPTDRFGGRVRRRYG
jgi:hypothetical protein